MLSRDRQRPIPRGRTDLFDHFTSNELEMMIQALNMMRMNGYNIYNTSGPVPRDFAESDQDSLYSEYNDDSYLYLFP